MFPLFEQHPWQSVALVVFCASIAHYGAEKLPLQYYVPALMLVIFVALSSVILLIVAHHRDRHYSSRSQTQDELLLVATFGLWWFCILLGVRWYYAEGHALLHNGPTTATAYPIATRNVPTTTTLTTVILPRATRTRATRTVHYFVERWRLI